MAGFSSIYLKMIWVWTRVLANLPYPQSVLRWTAYPYLQWVPETTRNHFYDARIQRILAGYKNGTFSSDWSAFFVEYDVSLICYRMSGNSNLKTRQSPYLWWGWFRLLFADLPIRCDTIDKYATQIFVLKLSVITFHHEHMITLV